MARRPKHLHPQPRLHANSGHARVRIAGEEFWLGRCGSPQAAAEYDRLIGEWLAAGTSRPPSRHRGPKRGPDSPTSPGPPMFASGAAASPFTRRSRAEGTQTDLDVAEAFPMRQLGTRFCTMPMMSSVTERIRPRAAGR